MSTPETILFEDLPEDIQEHMIEHDYDEEFIWYVHLLPDHQYEARCRSKKDFVGRLDVEHSVEPGWCLVIYERD